MSGSESKISNVVTVMGAVAGVLGAMALLLAAYSTEGSHPFQQISQAEALSLEAITSPITAEQ